jgi:diacylglycerol kinase (ATP)
VAHAGADVVQERAYTLADTPTGLVSLAARPASHLRADGSRPTGLSAGAFVTSTLLEPGRREPLSGQALVVANPAAAGVAFDVVADVYVRLQDVCPDVEIGWTTGPGSAAALVSGALADSSVSLVVAVGGDGTVREVAETLAAAAAPAPVLLALPAGSGNSTCRNLWGDLSVSEVLDLALDPSAARVRELDLLRLDEPGVVALLGTSSGFLAQVLIEARGVDPTLTGVNRYYAAAAGVLAALPAYHTRVVVDGAVLYDGPACSVAVGGGRFRARAFQFLPESLLDDGLLDVSTIAALDADAVQTLVPLVPGGTHLSRDEVTYARGRHVVIERIDGEPLVAEYDGEVWDAAGPRLTIEILPGALRALAPLHPPCG